MGTWMRRAGAVVLMALAWAVTWAPIAVVVGTLVDPDDSMDECVPLPS